MRILFTLLFVAVTDRAAYGDLQPRPQFRLPECEAYLLKSRDRYLSDARARMSAASPLGVTVERVTLTRRAPPDPEIDDPQFVWFDRDADETTADVERRLAIARAGHAAERLDRQRLIRQGRFRARWWRREANLSELESRALGLDPRQRLAPSRLSGRVFVGDDGGWRIPLFARGGVVGQLNLPAADLEQGLYNRVLPWQWDRHRAARNKKSLGSVRAFVADQSRTMLSRRDGSLRFGYVLDGGGAGRVSVVLIRPCARLALRTDDLIFPRRGTPSGSLNLCLVDTGLRINLGDPRPASE